VPKRRKGELTVIATVGDIMEVMERFAPLHLAESWDNCGLQIGSRTWAVRRIRIALDPLVTVIQAAAHDKVDLLITHHPLIFNPLRCIDLQTAVGRTVETALGARVALYAAHTNLDSALQGVNDALARVIGLRDGQPLVAADRALFDGDGARPGMGRVGCLPDASTLKVLVEKVKVSLGLNYIKYSGDPDLKIDRAAVCSGSGSSLLAAFLSSPAQVYISGDLRYHDARKVEEAGRALIDIGHFHSERLVLGPLAERLQKTAAEKGWQMDVQVCRLERDPFAIL
jgi:GTP cyclohydrolase I